MSADILVQGKAVRQLAGDASAWVDEMPQYAKRIELRTVGQVTTIYKAWAAYGTAESAASWMIVKITLDETSGLDVTEGLAGGVAGIDAFAYSWDNRASHTYS